MKTILAWIIAIAVASCACAQTPDKEMLPGYTGAVGSGYTPATTTDLLYCWTFAPRRTLTNFTKMAVDIVSGTGTTTASFGLYTTTGTTSLIAHVTGAAAGVLKATGLTPFTLTAGTLYRICHCASTGSVVAYTQVQQATTCCQNNNLTQLVQAFHPEYIGVADEACTAGVLPSMTGSITAEVASPGRLAKRFPLVLVEQ